MQTWYFPYPQERLNDATEVYVRTVEIAAERIGARLKRVGSIAEIPPSGNVFVIDCKTACRLVALRPRCRYWLWLQGAVPEEVELEYGSRARMYLWTLRERLAIPRAAGVFMVSRAMQQHYASKYGFRRLQVCVMPCANQSLDPNAFTDGSRYLSPSFVYAGSMHRWQCFELTLDVFRRVQRELPHATLSVLTGDQVVARRQVEAAGLIGVSVGRVPLSELQGALGGFKYGFVLRRPHVVNAVATPTKVSSYMASGVIPVLTPAVHDYVSRLGHLSSLVLAPSAEPDDVAASILRFEEKTVSPQAVMTEYRRVFDEYFEHSNYYDMIAEFLRSTGFARA